MSNHIERLQGQIEPLRNQIINHKVYGVIENISDLKIFMQYHVYAVWDFMSLLKSLQNNLTCTSIPWFPVGDAETRYLINEIVLGEESDVDRFGKRTSHFELYLEAMDKFGANVSIINQFISSLKNGKTLSEAFQASSTPLEASEFVNFTFEVINSNKAYLQSAVFTFGREDLIPSMFHALINDMYQENSESISYFKYYLERHIEVDGDHHSHLALQMTANLCGDDDQKWIEAENVVLNSLRHRLQLWDGAYNEIVKTKDLVC
jgi:hypothetical protein